MKTLASLLLISATFAGAAAYAQEPSGELDYPPVHDTASTVTRAQIQAELQAAKAAGLVTFGEIDEPATQVAASTVSRRSEEHTSELQSLMRISYAVFCLKKK